MAVIDVAVVVVVTSIGVIFKFKFELLGKLKVVLLEIAGNNLGPYIPRPLEGLPGPVPSTAPASATISGVNSGTITRHRYLGSLCTSRSRLPWRNVW